MPSVTRGGTKKDSSDDLPPSARAADPLAIAGPFDDGNANGDHNDGTAEGASEDPNGPQTTNAILDTTMTAMYEALKEMTSTITQDLRDKKVQQSNWLAARKERNMSSWPTAGDSAVAVAKVCNR